MAATGGRTVIEAGQLARLLVVPATILSYFEARLPEVRALREGGQRLYRAEDAVLLAGIATLLYRDGMTFRDVAVLLATERDRVVALGRERLKGHVAEGGRPPQRAIPEDAVVRSRGGDVREAPAAVARGAAEAVLSELLDCVRLLEAARTR